MADLGILCTHPVQYYAPWFRDLAQRLDIVVYYAHQQSARGQATAGFGVPFEWDVPLLDGYPYRWLANVSRDPGVHWYGGCDTPEIEEVVAAGSVDALLVMGWSFKSAHQAIRACRRYDVPVLMRGDSHLGRTRWRLRNLVKYVPYRWFLRRLSGHLYVGQRNREYLEYFGVPADRLFFVPHCVDNDFFRDGARRAVNSGHAAEIRRRLGAGPHDRVIAVVGKLTAGKRVGDVIQATAALAARGGSARYHAVVIGDGPARPALERLAAGLHAPVHFAGFQNQSALPGYYAAADMLAMPSVVETWGLVVNEAMACGVPAVVSSGVGCAPDLIIRGRTGYTYPVGDVTALADRLHELAGELDGAGASVRAAVARRIDEYSPARASSGLEEALSAVGKRRPSTSPANERPSRLRRIVGVLRGAWRMSRWGADVPSRLRLFLIRASTHVDRSRRAWLVSLLRAVAGWRSRDGLVRLVLRERQHPSAATLSIALRHGDIGDYQSICECLGSDMYPLPDVPISYVFDGGAHIGMFSVSAALRLGTLEHVVMVEPNPENLSLLRSNAGFRFRHDILPVALDGCDAVGSFELATSNTGHLAGAPGHGSTGRAVPVRRQRLPAVVPEEWDADRTWLKLDIEGAEHAVLPELLASGRRPAAVCVEVHDFLGAGGDALVESLREAGYRVRVSGAGVSGNVCRRVHATYRRGAGA